MAKLCRVALTAMVLGLLTRAPACAQSLPNAVPPAGAWAAAGQPAAPSSEQPLTPWWNEQVTQPLDSTRAPLSMSLDASVQGVLMFSPQVRIAADVPMIRQTQIVDAASRFDPRAYIDSKFTDTSDPVGNLLTTGGSNRFIDQTWTAGAGIRKTITTGGQLEAAHKFGYQDNNSNFFIPKDQATSRITLTYTQPLLNGSGKFYNTSLICLAELNTQAASSQLIRELQAVLMDTHRAYWDLRLQRAALLQRSRLKQSAMEIQAELQARADFDVLQSQVVRANAAVATRDAAVIRYATEVANAETRLRALINDPVLAAQSPELLPTMTPYHEGIEPKLVDSLTVALQNRPEIQRDFMEIRAAGVRANVSKNELLPVFNMLLGTYVYGLQGDVDYGDAWVNQFDSGRPTYWAGLQFEYPLFNRGANARLTQRRIELRQATYRLQQTMVQVRAETETAVREVTTTYREMLSKFHAMQADRTEIEYLTARWRLAIDDQQIAGVVLNDLLSAQERLAQAEYDFAAAEAAYNVALANLNSVTGTLLQADRVQILDAQMDGLPTLDVRSIPAPGQEISPVPTRPAPSAPPNPPAAVEFGAVAPSVGIPQVVPASASAAIVQPPPATPNAPPAIGGQTGARLLPPDFSPPPPFLPLPRVVERAGPEPRADVR